MSCNFGKKQHPRRPSVPPVIPPITSSHLIHDDDTPKSPKLQMAHENTFQMVSSTHDSEGDNISKGKDDRIIESTHLRIIIFFFFLSVMEIYHSLTEKDTNHYSKPKGRARSTHHHSNNNNNNNKHIYPSSQTARNPHKMPAPQNDHTLPPSSHSLPSSHFLPSSHPHTLPHSQFTMPSQMMPTMYPTTSWVPTQDGWVPYVVPQFYPPAGNKRIRIRKNKNKNKNKEKGKRESKGIKEWKEVILISLCSFISCRGE